MGLAGACEPEPEPAEPLWAEAFDTTASGALSGVWGSGPDDVFIVGGKTDAGEVYHFDGDTWAPQAVPASTDLLVWVFGFAPDDVFAVGVGGSAVHYDGRAWAALDTGTDADLWGVSASPMTTCGSWAVTPSWASRQSSIGTARVSRR